MDHCLCLNKGAHQLCSNCTELCSTCNCTADQRLCFGYVNSAIPFHPKSEIFFCDCTGRFVSHLVGNPKTGFLTCAACAVEDCDSKLICLKLVRWALDFQMSRLYKNMFPPDGRFALIKSG